MLVIADEDYKGVNPTYPRRRPRPSTPHTYVAALQGCRVQGIGLGTLDTQGVPHISASSATTRRSSGISATTG